ncbi:unnamed protein product, partial [Ectocarpus sp. 4 AP-2014]
MVNLPCWVITWWICSLKRPCFRLKNISSRMAVNVSRWRVFRVWSPEMFWVPLLRLHVHPSALSRTTILLSAGLQTAVVPPDTASDASSSAGCVPGPVFSDGDPRSVVPPTVDPFVYNLLTYGVPLHCCKGTQLLHTAVVAVAPTIPGPNDASGVIVCAPPPLSRGTCIARLGCYVCAGRGRTFPNTCCIRSAKL